MELDLTPFQHRNSILIAAAKLGEQTPNGVHLEAAHNLDTALADNGGGIEMADGQMGPAKVSEDCKSFMKNY
jgi:hypothetical protein